MALLREAVLEILADGIPKSSSQLTTASRKAAEQLLEWMTNDSNALCSHTFTSAVVDMLDKAFLEVPTQSHAACEKMWGMYYSIRTSHEFKSLWMTFLQEANIPLIPNLYQTVTDRLFQNHIEFHFPLSDSEASEVEDDKLTFEKESAIRYAGGYVFCSVKKQIQKSSNPQKQQLVEAIELLLKDGDEQDISCCWVEIVDRGGLIHINDDLYRVFIARKSHRNDVLAQRKNYE